MGGSWRRRVRRSWDAEDRADRAPATDPAAELERLERELLDERRKVVERDIEIAGLRAQLEETNRQSGSVPENGGD